MYTVVCMHKYKVAPWIDGAAPGKFIEVLYVLVPPVEFMSVGQTNPGLNVYFKGFPNRVASSASRCSAQPPYIGAHLGDLQKGSQHRGRTNGSWEQARPNLAQIWTESTDVGRNLPKCCPNVDQNSTNA